MSVRHRVFAAMYDTLSASVERRELSPRRARLLSALAGTVVDVGAGTGANLRHFRHADRVILVEPDPYMRARLRARLGESPVPVEVSDADAEHLPLPDGTADAVVFTLVLCSVPDQRLALLEARRVLKPGGTLAVLEHVRGQGRAARWQDRLDGLWGRCVAPGCHLNRNTVASIGEAGFEFTEVSRLEAPAVALATPIIAGTAVKRS
ncbi:class I SAM-dependent methyltransferase [Pseudarthrobacter cellobiosi]|uniref:class I SAM-dependent methyltransferase n=1 Tax=Pseudarthrobacter cellobiosi TaxID=2953654 RepID=UPI00208E9D80|nr:MULTISPECIES: class I SAM-dependent methyltransferase [unclassified Pseudarthrobacter]MCO4256090.1 class I SAM-dependent methyltransferase [Pseudarthrobacter sp. HLT1-5]MCO4275461.1 class I SAM-dependent methyltransferase [Pseudarthrobacter sp. HLT3-5]